MWCHRKALGRPGRKNYLLSTVDLDQENTEDKSIERGQLGLNAESCKFLGISAGDEVNIKVFVPPSKGLDLSLLRIEVDLRDGSSTHQPVLASDFVREFVKTFNKQIFTEFQSILLRYGGNSYHCTVADASLAVEKNSPAPKRGMLRKSTKLIVEVSSSMSEQINGAEIFKSIFRDGFDMKSLEQELISLNIGGMTSQIHDIIHLAFGSRMVSPANAKRLNLKHIKGMLLYGPPGSGKTLIARSICKLLNAKEPLIVRGPEITQELYGASERHIRALFDAAEKDEKQYGSKSDLHVIIFDEIDSIGKKRGAAAGSFQHDDKIVNQLLTMIDGTTELNNIFIIATTNRKDLLDEALLRDGRIELHIKIDYPDEQGRKQILDVCTRKWRQASLLDRDVDLQEIARRTIGYSGATLASLVTLSHSYANKELVDLDPMRLVKKNVKLTMNHFLRALEQSRVKLQESKQLR
ncbi:unnamed protein product [Ilex paraguariensis]|uniref:Vesicle-fusing ATPase n=1 Tax=Ilex paraguariensis TaxID=185542 RepID=A0ABC8QQI5_9AQUA